MPTNGEVLSQLQNVYGTPGMPGRRTAYSNLRRASGTCDDVGKFIVTNLGFDGGAGAGAATECNDAGYSNPAFHGSRTSTFRSAGNDAMTQIAHLNLQLQGLEVNRSTAATLMISRDQAIDKLSQLMDIRVSSKRKHQTDDLHHKRCRTGRAQASRSVSITRVR